MSPPGRHPWEGGEDRFLDGLARRFSGQVLPRGTLGIGDDAAVLPGSPVRVVTLDLLVERQHFSFALLSPRELAGRALEANLSDLAAMGARPEAVFLGLAWPGEGPASALVSPFLDGLYRACRKRGVPLLGGDTVRARPGAVTLAITAVGIPWPGGPVRRSNGRPGDILAVTGPLGGAALGLKILEGQVPAPRFPRERRLASAAIGRFRLPRARLEAARPLARWARALMDLSDGLGIDLPRLARASRCGFLVEEEAIPRHPALGRFLGPAAAAGLALSGGEDFELLAAVDPGRWAGACRALGRAGVDLKPLGRLLPPEEGEWLVSPAGRRPWPGGGWDPFSPRLDSRSFRSVDPEKRGGFRRR